MTRSVQAISIHPLFGDALSGEFHPPSDPEKRSHTLGRLAYATYLKGDVDESAEEGVFDYSPSWAPSVDVRLWCDTESESEILTIVGLSLSEGEDCNIEYYDSLSGGHRQRSLTIMSILDDSIHQLLPLELGPELNQARLAAAEAAQAFFDQIRA